MSDYEVLVRVKSATIRDFNYTEKEGSKTKEKWILIDNFITKKNSVLIRKSDLIRFLED